MLKLVPPLPNDGGGASLAADTLEFDCPRCHANVVEVHYGPCRACVVELRSTQGLGRKSEVVADYVPKMNVIPNAVASKD